MKWRALTVVFSIVMLIAMSASHSTLMADHNERSTKKKVTIIGGGAAAGAVIGGMIDGKDGALAGAIAGGSAGAIYDRATRDNGHRVNRSSRDKALIIAGSAAAGATAGGVAAGKKGALIGAGIGALGGYILHKRTKDDGRVF